jgi:Zn-dependent protease/CBS domain-containing protein
VAGIPIRVHWTFAVLLVWVLFSGVAQGKSLGSGIVSAAFMLAVFLCVLLHELGHAVVARGYGVRTRDITLLPIGGVASLERMPEKPSQELLIAVAGPLVNVVIAGVLFASLAWRESLPALLAVNQPGFHLRHFLANLAAINAWLVLFNLIPAFPMDGGRVLRALLARRLGYLQATQLAARIGQGVAVVMALVGMWTTPMLLLIALFVWIAGTAELQATTSRSALRGLPVAAAMERRFQVLATTDTLEAAARALLAGAQHDFPVTDGGRPDQPVVGVLTRHGLLTALAGGDRQAPVRDVMRTGIPAVDEDASLERAVEEMRGSRAPLLPVVHDGRLVGLLTSENVAELVAIRAASPATGGR